MASVGDAPPAGVPVDMHNKLLQFCLEWEADPAKNKAAGDAGSGGKKILTMAAEILRIMEAVGWSSKRQLLNELVAPLVVC